MISVSFVSPRQFREALTSGQKTVAREDVGEASAEQAGEDRGEQPVAEPVAAPIGLLDFRLAGSDDHVEPFLDQAADELGGGGGVVGRIAVGHHIDVRLDVGEHSSDHMALPLHPFLADDRSCRLRDLAGAVAAIIVVDVDERRRQSRPERRHRLGDRRLLIVAWEEDCDPKLRLIHLSPREALAAS